jgi:outer membrane protein assembly factor BamB
VAWRGGGGGGDVCTPLVYQGRLFVGAGDRQMGGGYKPATGDKVWQGKLGVREIFSASPTGADGKIYCMSEEATIVVLSAGENFEILSTVALEEGPAMSSIVAAGGRLFVRTAKNLYCIGNK